MTRIRYYGEDSPFGQWTRNNPYLGSSIHQAAFTANDADWIFHRYHVNGDGIGIREVQCIMIVEVKTRGRRPTGAQAETLFHVHQLLNKRKKLNRMNGQKKVSVWSHGVHILSMDGERPDDGCSIFWGSFNDEGNINWTRLDGECHLNKILSFDLDPTTLECLDLRRHHLTRELLSNERTPLGFQCLRKIKCRS